jgi:Fe-S cluster assembly scaffold protein SufB
LAQTEFLAHCTFPNTTKLEHRMDVRMHIGADTTMKYNEAHFHSPHGGIEARPRAQVTVDEGGQSVTTFNLMHGRAGALEFDYTVDVAAHGVVELTTKAYGIERDAITVRELIRLNSEGARSVTKTRATLRDDATSQMFTTTEAGAPNARGHMDCTETVRGHAIARNIPRKYPRSKSLRASRWLGVVG